MMTRNRRFGERKSIVLDTTDGGFVHLQLKSPPRETLTEEYEFRHSAFSTAIMFEEYLKSNANDAGAARAPGLIAGFPPC